MGLLASGRPQGGPTKFGCCLFTDMCPCAAQIPQHLECPEEPLPPAFRCYSALHRRFYRCARTWLCQAGILDKRYIESGRKGTPKHAKTVPTFLNRVLGMNLQQQQLVFECAPTHIRLPQGSQWWEPVQRLEMLIWPSCGSADSSRGSSRERQRCFARFLA